MRRSLRLPAAIVSAVLVAEVAVWLLRPDELPFEPVSVEARAYFSQRQLARAEDFRSGQRWIGLGALAVELGVLAGLAARPPRRLRDRLVQRPVLGAAAAAALLSAAVTAAGLPLSALARERAMDVGLVTQSWPGWAWDVARSQAIASAIAGAGGALLVVGIRRFGRRWWAPGAAVVVAYGVLSIYAGPVVLDPVFNDFRPARPELQADIRRLAEQAGVEVDEVLVMDASRRTTAANAYVAGLGSTKRVVLYDNLVDDFPQDEVRLVVAHELAHVRYDDLPNGLIYLAIVAPFGLFAASRLSFAFGAGPDARAVPATALALALVVPVVTAVSNQLSRKVEMRADAFSLQLTGDPGTQIEFHRRLAVKNVSDPDPPGAWHAVFGTHPTTLQRIGLGVAARREGS